MQRYFLNKHTNLNNKYTFAAIGSHFQTLNTLFSSLFINYNLSRKFSQFPIRFPKVKELQ